tara:strand:- start:2974 stop:3975 length:1002 start_codon:yes stop_codon:yes gene_type:complete
MSAEPRIYRYDDTDAPVPSSREDAFYEIMRACLVDGYGNQPAAGWSVVYDDWAANGICTFTNACQSGVIGAVRLDSVINYSCCLFVADAMINSTNAVNARSGDNSISDVSAMIGVSGNSVFSGHSDRWKNWVVVANENFVFATFALKSSYLTGSYSSVGWTYFENIAFGSARSLRGLGDVSDAAVGNFVLVGAPIGSYSSVGWNVASAITCRDEMGGVPMGVVYGYLWPWSLGGMVSAGINDAGNIVEFQVSAVELWGGESSASKDIKQLSKLPMLLMSCSMMSDDAVILADYLAPQRVGAIAIVAGKNCYCVNMPSSSGGFLFVSMELGDWV